MLIKSAGFGSNAGYNDTSGTKSHTHTRLIPNRYWNSYYFYDGNPYNVTNTGYSYGTGAIQVYGGLGYSGTNSNYTNQMNNGHGAIKIGCENYYVSDLFGGYNGQPTTWTICQREHDEANWKYSAAIIELFMIYYDAQTYARYLVYGYTTPSIATLETAGGTTALGLQVVNRTLISGNYFRYDIQATGLGNYRIGYFTLRTQQQIVGHTLPTGTAYQDIWSVQY